MTPHDAAKATLDVIRSLRSASSIKVNRNFDGFFADRLMQAVGEPTLLAAVNRLAMLLDAEVEYVGGARTAALLSAAASEHAPHVLAWMRAHTRIVAMLAMLGKEEDYRAAIASLDIAVTTQDDSKVEISATYDISLTVTCLSPLAHGADTKAGNATLFRRRQMLTPSGRVIEMPFYGGNALRGLLRDLLADDMLQALGLSTSRTTPALSLWFFHTLYAGGVLEEGGGKATDKIEAELGRNGAVRTEGLRRLRNMLPGLSLLGAAAGNRILSGRIAVSDLLPCCADLGTGPLSAHQLIGHEYLTRRDDYEGRTEEERHAGMIATTEVLKPGTVLRGGIDVDRHATEIERAALGRGLQLLAGRGLLGAENRRGFGKVAMTIEGAPDPAPYLTHLAERREEIVAYLSEIGAVHASRVADLVGA